MNQILVKIIRHLLTAVGGVGMATDSNVQELAGAVSFIAGIAWSIWEAKRTKQTVITPIPRVPPAS